MAKERENMDKERENMDKERENMAEEREGGDTENLRVEDEISGGGHESKVEQDFLYYLDEAYKVFEGAKLKEKDSDIVNAWFNRLIGEPSETLEKTKLRNGYILELLLQLKDGNLEEVFESNPPEGALKPLQEAFKSYRRTRKLCPEEMKNSEMKGSEVRHVSEDNRIYCSCKAMPDDGGACGFLAVSYGGGDPLWLNTEGEPIEIKERKDLTVRYVEDDDFFKIENPDSSFIRFERDPGKKGKLRCFYSELLAAIDKEIRQIRKQPGWYTGIEHHSLRNIVNKILNVTDPGKNDKATPVECLKPILYALKLKIQCKLDESAIKENVDDEFDEDAKLVDLGLRIYPASDQEIWCETFKIDINEFCLRELKKIYPDCLIDAFISLLNKQKGVILSQEQRDYENLVSTAQEELSNKHKELIKAYKMSADEYNRIMEMYELISQRKYSKKSEKAFKNGELENSEDECKDNKRLISELKQEVELADAALNESIKANDEIDMTLKATDEHLKSLRSRGSEIKKSTNRMIESNMSYLNKLKSLVDKQEEKIKKLRRRGTYNESSSTQ